MLRCSRAMSFSAEIISLAFAALFVALGLHGCGDSSTTTTTAPSKTTAPSNTTTQPKTTAPPKTTTTTRDPREFTLPPICGDGIHLVECVSRTRFQIVGIGFPDGMMDESVETWIATLVNIKKKGQKVNTVRLYEFPQCFFTNKWCFQPFMKKADELGMYVLLPGSSTARYLNVNKQTAQAGYTDGSILDFGRLVVSGAFYPNTLAVVLGNENFDPLKINTFQFVTAIKAYARDLKAYMTETCNMKNPIPLMYASRDLGDKDTPALMEALSCGTAETSIDFFGNNNERWCSNSKSSSYDGVKEFLKDLQLPLPFFFSEMGCTKKSMCPHPDDHTLCPREWNDVKDFFETFKRIQGYVAYTYWRVGDPDFFMFDGKFGNSTMNEDGKNFFEKIAGVKQVPAEKVSVSRPVCKKKFSDKIDMFPLEDYKAYNVADWGADKCPDASMRSASRHELPRGEIIT